MLKTFIPTTKVFGVGIYHEVKLVNYEDIAAEARGIIKPEEVRSITLKSRIDTGATCLVLTKHISLKLGLREIKKTNVRYANGKPRKRWLGSGVEVELKGRTALTRPIIENDDSEVLVGNPILEEMDFFINTKTGEIYPNPESPDMPLHDVF